MWKTLLLAALFSVAHQLPETHCPNCINAHGMSGMLRTHLDACLAESHADPAALAALLAGKPADPADPAAGKPADPADPSLKAPVYCLLMRCKIISKDGKLHKSAVLAKMVDLPDGDDASKILDSCAEQPGATPEDIAMNIFRCFYDKKLFIFNYMPADHGVSSNDTM